MSAWTPVPKPTESSILVSGGDAQPFGLLIAITSVTSSAVVTSIVSGWSDVNKPTIASWVAVSKPVGATWTIVAKPSS